jgi:hypothetical protein
LNRQEDGKQYFQIYTEVRPGFAVYGYDITEKFRRPERMNIRIGASDTG